MSRKSVATDLFAPQDNAFFEVESFDSAIEEHGVDWIHHRALPCPIGVTDLYDIHSHSDHDNCSNGNIYEVVGTLKGFFSGNQSMVALEDLGILETSTAQVTLARFYTGTNDEVAVQPSDRFFMKDFEGARTTSQRFEHSQAESDRLNFPALQVFDVMDSHGNRYKQDHDFVLDRGQIKWVNQRRPGYDPKSERGEICSVRYSYRPFFYVKNLIHDVRVAKNLDVITGETTLVRMPYAVLLQREYIMQNEKNDDKRPDDRDVRGPRKGSFGAR